MEEALFIEIQRFCQLVHQRRLNELVITRPNFSLSLTSIPANSVTTIIAPTESILPVQGPSEESTQSMIPTGFTIESPLVGIFYRTPSPDAPPFVEVGDVVEIGQTVGIVEAMKVFNEITTDKAGKVIHIAAQNGAMVQVNEPLFIIEPQ